MKLQRSKILFVSTVIDSVALGALDKVITETVAFDETQMFLVAITTYVSNLGCKIHSNKMESTVEERSQNCTKRCPERGE